MWNPFASKPVRTEQDEENAATIAIITDMLADEEFNFLAMPTNTLPQKVAALLADRDYQLDRRAELGVLRNRLVRERDVARGDLAAANAKIARMTGGLKQNRKVAA